MPQDNTTDSTKSINSDFRILSKTPSREALIYGLELIIDEYEKDQSMIIEDIKKLLGGEFWKITKEKESNQ